MKKGIWAKCPICESFSNLQIQEFAKGRIKFCTCFKCGKTWFEISSDKGKNEILDPAICPKCGKTGIYRQITEKTGQGHCVCGRNWTITICQKCSSLIHSGNPAVEFNEENSQYICQKCGNGKTTYRRPPPPSGYTTKLAFDVCPDCHSQAILLPEGTVNKQTYQCSHCHLKWSIIACHKNPKKTHVIDTRYNDVHFDKEKGRWLCPYCEEIE